MEGKLGGLRYDFGVRIGELMPKRAATHEVEVAAGSRPARISAGQVEGDACGDPVEVWESEGGH